MRSLSRPGLIDGKEDREHENCEHKSCKSKNAEPAVYATSSPRCDEKQDKRTDVANGSQDRRMRNRENPALKNDCERNNRNEESGCIHG